MAEEKIQNKSAFNFKKLTKLINIKLIIISMISVICTLGFFYFSSYFFENEKKEQTKIDIYDIAKKEAIKLGRLEPDEKEEIIIGPDGKVIIPELTYVDVGGMGPNWGKSFVSNVKGSDHYLSFDINFSSYEGEKLTNYLTEFDQDFRALIIDEIDKRNTSELMGSKNRNKFLRDIATRLNQYLIDNDEEPVIFAANFKNFVVNQH